MPVVEVCSRDYGPGGAANVSANVVRLGSTAYLAGVVGRDEAAGRLLAELRSRRVLTDGVISDPTRPTTSKTRVIARGQQVLRIDSESRVPLSPGMEDELLDWVVHRLPKADACIVSDYAKGVVSSRVARETIKQARALGKPVVVDPKETDYASFRGAAVVKPNRQELERFVNREIHDHATLISAGRKLSAILNSTALLVTLGCEGMLLFQEGVEPVVLATTARSVFDVTGAGDTVAAILALALAQGRPLQQAARLANLAAGIAVSKSGAAAVSVDELLTELAASG